MSDSQGLPPPPPPPPSPPPLPSVDTGTRVAPPWEQAGPPVQRFVDTAKGVLTQPAAFFRAMRREGGLGPPVVYALIGVVVGSLGSFLTTTIMPFGGFGDSGGFFFTLLMVPLLSLIGLFIGSAILHVLFLLVAGSRQSFETTFRLMAYTSGTTSPFNIIPFLGGLVAGVWALLILILGGAEAHEVPQGKAVIAVLLPAVVCCGAAMLFGGALLALIFGAAAAGMQP